MDENTVAQAEVTESGEAVQAPAEEQGAQVEAAGAGPAAEPTGSAGRDFAGEVAELAREFPEAGRDGRLPEEVVTAAVREGKTVVEAYREYALAHAGQDRVRQAWANVARAPVRGVSGSWPVEDQARDAFLRGFEEA